MHIKSITLSGFKSYRDPVTLELDARHNVIIGRNGYGKSNIFDAIRFVFGDQFGAMRADDKTKLIFDQGNAQYIQASVTITLDNSDGRLPIEGTSVAVGRTVGLKKDEFFLGGKSVKKGDIQSILESAGFSRSNPYYVVAQGKVAELTKMDARARLELIKNVAGTHVYEERRSESLRILEHSDAQRAQIHEIIESIDARLGELGSERDELAAFQQLDRTRRALEYCLYSSEMKKASEELDALSKSRDDEGGRLAELRAAAEAQAGALAGLEGEVKALAGRVRGLEADKRAASEAVPRTAHRRVKLAGRVAELESRAAVDAETRAGLAKEAAALGERIAAVRAQLDASAPGSAGAARAAAEAAYEAVKGELNAVTARMDAIYDKQGRGKRFKSRKERDAHLQKLAEEAGAEQAAKEAAAASADKDAKAAAAKAAKAAAGLAAARKELGVQAAKEAELAAAADGQLEARAAADAARKAAWAKQQELEGALRAARERVAASERALHQATPPPVRAGLETIRQLMEAAAKAGADGGDVEMDGAGSAKGGKKGKGAGAGAGSSSGAAAGAGALLVIRGIHGPLLDLVRTTHPRYQTAVDVIAATQLLNVVVDTEQTASDIIEHLMATKGGRVTLMPLNRLAQGSGADVPTYPKADDCRPLMQFLEFDKAHEAAVRQVFGRVLLCRDLAVAASYAKAPGAGFTCITLEGDMVNKKGAVQGGYREAAANRLVHASEIRAANSEIGRCGEELKAAQAAALSADQRMSTLRGEEQRVSSERSAARDTIRRLDTDVARCARDAETAGKAEEAAKTAAAASRAAAELLAARVASLTAEMGTELTSSLSSAEEAELGELSARADGLKAKLATAAATLEAARSAATKLTSELELKLLKRQAEVAAALGKSAASSASGGAGAGSAPTGGASPDDGSLLLREDLKAAKAELVAAVAAEDAAGKALATVEAALAAATEELTARRAAMDGVRAEAARTAEAIAGESVQADKIMERRRAALRKRDESAAKLREVGTLPAAEIDSWSGRRKRELIASLAETHDKLKAFSHVNKKAAEQFATFSEEREALLARVAELDKSDGSIRDLVRTLDARKDEAIARTFKGVAGHFKQVFSELIPKGSASMTILTSGLDEDDDEDEEDEEEVPAEDLDVDDTEGPSGAGAGSSKGGKKGASKAKAKKGGKKSGAGAGATPTRGGSATAALRNAVETYKGLRIQASFTDAGESLEVGLLSGGQMALVSLALIFAIQRTDPAPFYLLDEIDAALDPTYRRAVAALIRKQATDAESPSQFISTTFKHELLEAGDKWLAVSMHNKVSRVTELGLKDAGAFLKRIPQNEQDVGTDSVSGRGAGGSVSDRLSVATGSTAAGGGTGPGPASKRLKTAAGGAAAAAAAAAGGGKKGGKKKGGKGRSDEDDDEEEGGADEEEEGDGDDDGSVSSGPSGDEPLNA